MRKSYQQLFLIICTTFIVGSCMENESYSEVSTDQLTFSVDTIHFDTIISGEATSTKLFKIYNTNKKDIFVSSVSLSKGNSSPFHLNIDGAPIPQTIDNSFEVRSNDSIYAFVEVNASAQDKDSPYLCEDNLTFNLSNGASQKIYLEAYAQTVIPLVDKHFSEDTTLSAIRPYRVMDTLWVDKNVKLTIKEGVKLLFHNNAALIVNGKLRVEGTLNNPVIFRSDRLDNMFTNQRYDDIPGQWEGIKLNANSVGNYLNYCDIHGGNYGVICDSTGIDEEKLHIENSIIHNVNGSGLELHNCSAYVGNTQITNALKNCVTIYGGSYDFIHCTIANFYSFDALRGHALDFSNIESDLPQPLQKAKFINCIITGYSTDEIFGNSSTDETIAFNYFFKNCLLDTEKSDNTDHFINCQWDSNENIVSQEKNFSPTFDLEALTFTFIPDSLSLSVGNADYTTTLESYPNDRLGIDRTSNNKSDIGCYEYINKKK